MKREHPLSKLKEMDIVILRSYWGERDVAHLLDMSRGDRCGTIFRYDGGGGVKRQTHLHNYVQLVLKRKTMLGIYQWKVSLSKLSLIPDYDYIVCFD